MTKFERLYFNSSKGIVENAKLLRKNQTEAEQKLWRYLRNRNLDGFKFRRQHYIRHYIVDFYCAEKMLSIELDGGIHKNKEVVIYDKSRTEYLEQLGIKEIRFKNEEVLTNVFTVLEKIRTTLNEINHLSLTPLQMERGRPTLLVRGEV